MITISDILHLGDIDLDLKTTNLQEAINHVASLLREDDRVTDWNAFYQGLTGRQPCLEAAGGSDICIPHARTDGVSGMVMCAGRSTAGILSPEAKQPIHFIFVIGVPVALAADYLRIIGALTRIFKTAANTQHLRQVKDPAEFLQILASLEMKL